MLSTMIERMTRAFSGLRKSQPLQSDQPGVAAISRSGYGLNLACGFTPKRLQAILAAADAGDIVGQHELFARMEETDEHLHAELSKRRRALLSVPWMVRPGRAGDTRAEEVAAAVSEQLARLPDFEDAILDLASAIGHGFACLEIEWGWDGEQRLPAALYFRPQDGFQLSRDFQRLMLRDATAEGQELWPWGWVVHRHASISGLFQRQGLFRPVSWAWLLRRYCLSDFAEYLEIHGMPLRLGKYPSGTTDADRSALLRALTALGHDAAGAIPDTMAIEFHEAARGSEEPFRAMHDICERGISKAVLGSTLTTDTQGVGSQALGEIHNEVRLDILRSDARQIAGTITRQLCAPLAYLNLGVTDPAQMPVFEFDCNRPEDLEKLAKSLPQLSDVMDIPAAWAHRRAGIPMPEDGEACLTRKTAPQAAPQPAGGEPGRTADTRTTASMRQAGHAVTALGARETDGPAPGEWADPGQAAVDGVEIPEEVLAALAEDLLAPILAEAGRCGPQELLGKLSELFPRMDTTGLEELVARCIFVGDMWGRVQAQEPPE